MPDNALKALIRKTETGKTDPAVQYETIIGHNQNKLAKPLTQMSVGEIIAASDGWRKRFGTTSGAAGAYQIIKPTLIGLVKQLALDPTEKFTPAIQEDMADSLLVQRGLGRFLRGDMTVTEFGNALAREWASFPVLSTQKRGEATLKRGQSYYDKFAGNSALISPETVEATLKALRAEPPYAPLDVTETVPPASTPTYQPGDTDEPSPGEAPGLTAGEIAALAIILLAVLALGWLVLQLF